jgi:hypothetical protein
MEKSNTHLDIKLRNVEIWAENKITKLEDENRLLNSELNKYKVIYDKNNNINILSNIKDQNMIENNKLDEIK